MVNSKLKSRIKKLEEKTPKGRWVYPFGYYYGEEGCEPYWTDEPVKTYGCDAYYDEIEKEKKGMAEWQLKRKAKIRAEKFKV